jgi:uncharacterized protein
MPAFDFTLDLGADGDISARHYAPDEDVALCVTYILAPGAGVGHDSEFIVGFGERLRDRGLDVITFNFPFLEKGSKKPDGTARLEHCYLRVIDHVARSAIATQPLIVGGKSMGGRIASYMAARPGGFDHAIAGLMFLGYPLHAPQRPQQLRVAHFPDITVPMLFVQGTRDPFGTPAQIEPILSTLETPVRIHRVVGGDHSFSLPKKWTGAEPQVFDDAATVMANWVYTVILGRERPGTTEA